MKRLSIEVLAAAGALGLAGKIGGRALHLLTQLIIARLLGPTVFGVYALGFAILRIAGSISLLGLDKGVLRYVAKHNVPTDVSQLKGVLIQSVSLAFLAGAFVGGGLFLTAPWLADHVFGEPALVDAIRLFSIGVAFTSGLRVTAAATTSSLRVRYAVLSEEVVPPTVMLILLLIVDVFGWRLLGVIGSTVASYVLALALAVYFLVTLFPAITGSRVRMAWVTDQLLRFSIPAAVAGIMTVLVVWIDRLWVGAFHPSRTVGIYQAASQCSTFFVVILSGFAVIFAPLIATYHERHDADALSDAYRVITKWSIYAALPLFVVMFLIPGSVLSLLFGGAYVGGASALRVLAVGQLVNVSTGTVGLLLILTGHQRCWVGMASAALALDVVLQTLLVPTLNIVGAALATSATLTVLYGGGLMQVRSKLAMWPYDRRMWKGLAAASVSSGGLWIWQLWWEGSQSVEAATGVLLTLVLFVGTLVVLGLDHEDRHWIRVAFKRTIGNGG